MSNEETASEFVKKYNPIIKKYLISIVNNTEFIDDLVQEVYLKLLNSLRTFSHRGPGSFRAWLKTVVHTVHLDWLEKRRRSNLITLVDPQEITLANDPLAEKILIEYDKEVMQLAIARVRLEIDLRTWDIFEMAQIQGCAAEIVAGKFGVAVRTVYGASHRILKKLKEMCQYIDSKASG